MLNQRGLEDDMFSNHVDNLQLASIRNTVFLLRYNGNLGPSNKM